MRKRRRAKGKRFLLNLILVCAIAIFAVSAYKLITIGLGYQEGRSEYDEIKNLVLEYEENKDQEEEEEKFRVDFDKLLEINEDTIGWIRFSPEPSIISYPVVQGDDNDLYLHKTFSANDNTLGAIFLDVNCDNRFNNRNSIIYGHRMKDGSMFRKLEDYKDKAFWENNPYFYIYTPDGKEITYHIYSVGVVEDDAETYTLSFSDDAQFQSFIDYTYRTADYDTGVEVTVEDQVVTLSTCTAASDEHRFVVHGVKTGETYLEE